MTGITAFVYHQDYQKYYFGPTHPFKPVREKYTLDLLKELRVFNKKAKYYEPEPANEEDLMLVHTKKYVDFVKKMSEMGSGYLDYGDTPATKSIYEGSCSAVGGSLCAADLIMTGKVTRAFNPGGGLHHATENNAAGFCVFNAVAIVARYLQRKYGLKKIAIVDIDGHHGDGTQKIFYRDPILKISLHRYDGYFYPGTGSAEEIGEEGGEGYSINIPLPARTHDEAYLFAFNEIVIPSIRRYKPELILNQFGVDGHYQDPLVGLSLTTKTYEEISSTLHNLAHEISNGKFLILGGGGYNPVNVSRCWAVMFVTVSGAIPQFSPKYKKLLDDVKLPKESKILDKVMETVDLIRKTNINARKK